MAARDRYTVDIECPNCHEKGRLHISENDYPFMSNLNRNVDQIEGNYTAEMHNEAKIAIKCITCGNEFLR